MIEWWNGRVSTFESCYYTILWLGLFLRYLCFEIQVAAELCYCGVPELPGIVGLHAVVLVLPAISGGLGDDKLTSDLSDRRSFVEKHAAFDEITDHLLRCQLIAAGHNRMTIYLFPLGTSFRV